MKIGSIFLIVNALFLVAIFSITPVMALQANETPGTAPFITIDPIGNHNIGESFRIEGTTNLGAGTALYLDIGSAEYNPGGFGSSSFSSEYLIGPGSSVTNWSFMVIPSQWMVKNPGPPPYHLAPVAGKMIPGEYTAWVYSHDAGASVNSSQNFFIVSSEKTGSNPVSPTLPLTVIPPHRPESGVAEYEKSTAELPATPHSSLPIECTAVAIAAFVVVRKIA